MSRAGCRFGRTRPFSWSNLLSLCFLSLRTLCTCSMPVDKETSGRPTHTLIIVITLPYLHYTTQSTLCRILIVSAFYGRHDPFRLPCIAAVLHLPSKSLSSWFSVSFVLIIFSLTRSTLLSDLAVWHQLVPPLFLSVRQINGPADYLRQLDRVGESASDRFSKTRDDPKSEWRQRWASVGALFRHVEPTGSDSPAAVCSATSGSRQVEWARK